MSDADLQKLLGPEGLEEWNKQVTAFRQTNQRLQELVEESGMTLEEINESSVEPFDSERMELLDTLDQTFGAMLQLALDFFRKALAPTLKNELPPVERSVLEWLRSYGDTEELHVMLGYGIEQLAIELFTPKSTSTDS